MSKKIDYRTNIKFCVSLNYNLKKTEEMVKKAYGDKSPSSSTISRWWYFFKRGGENVEDGDRSGRPTQPVNPRLIKDIIKLIEEDPKISLSTIAALIGETKGYIYQIINSSTEFKKIKARWVPKVLNSQQK